MKILYKLIGLLSLTGFFDFVFEGSSSIVGTVPRVALFLKAQKFNGKKSKTGNIFCFSGLRSRS